MNRPACATAKTMTSAELRVRAREEVDELGPESLDQAERAIWVEERRGAVLLLAALAAWDQTLLRRAALEIANEWVERDSSQLFLDAAMMVERE